jgi:hypothetical protein
MIDSYRKRNRKRWWIWRYTKGVILRENIFKGWGLKNIFLKPHTAYYTIEACSSLSGCAWLLKTKANLTVSWSSHCVLTFMEFSKHHNTVGAVSLLFLSHKLSSYSLSEYLMRSWLLSSSSYKHYFKFLPNIDDVKWLHTWCRDKK